jgi:hypothetical protein
MTSLTLTLTRIKTYTRISLLARVLRDMPGDECKLCGGTGKNGGFDCGMCNGTGKEQ